MTRKELAIEIYKMDEKKIKHQCSEKEYVRRALNGIGMIKGFLKSDLLEMYTRRLLENKGVK